MKFQLLEGKTRKTTTKVDIKMKDGTVIPAGTPGVVRPLMPNELPSYNAESGQYYTRILLFHPEGPNARDYKLNMRLLAHYFTGFKAPSVKTMEKWEWDSSGCKTPVGTMVEPDGVDPDGWPSWMLILGII